MMKKNKHLAKLFLIILACNSYFFSYADETNNFIHLKAEVDRQQINARNVIEDSLGYLWLNSDIGILRFDGYEYKAYSFSEVMGKAAPNSSILDIAEDKNKKIWCVSKKGNISKLLSSGKFSSQHYY